MQKLTTLPGGRSDGDSVENYYVLSDDQLQSIVQRAVTDTLQQMSLDNLTAKPTGMSEGETDMAKRIRQKVMIGGKLHWVTGETQRRSLKTICARCRKLALRSGRPQRRKKRRR